MTLKEILKLDFGVELPISGGYGNSIETPIIIHRTDINDYVRTEYFILNCLGKGRKIKWKILKQELLSHNDKNIDKIKIETIQTTEFEIITQIENYYFDISECYGNIERPKSSFNENDTLDKIKMRLRELENLNEFNKKCIDLLKKGELFMDYKLASDFLAEIKKDESLTLFESMMHHTQKPIITVLRIIGKELNENYN